MKILKLAVLSAATLLCMESCKKDRSMQADHKSNMSAIQKDQSGKKKIKQSNKRRKANVSYIGKTSCKTRVLHGFIKKIKYKYKKNLEKSLNLEGSRKNIELLKLKCSFILFFKI